MMKLAENIQMADWKSEKHVPVIDCPSEVKADEFFQVKVTIGKEVAHPNTTAHHIRWIKVYFKEDGGKFVREVANVEFTAHGESAEGADKGPIYTNHEAVISMKTAKAGTVYSMSYCNIHGLWESQREIAVK